MYIYIYISAYNNVNITISTEAFSRLKQSVLPKALEKRLKIIAEKLKTWELKKLTYKYAKL